MQGSEFSPSFQALLKEAQFTKDILGAGATQVRRASYASKGSYFLAMTSLATGLERIGKLCLMLDHLLDHGRFPDLGQLKREIGHKILLIHERTEALVSRRKLKLSFRPRLDDPIHRAILACLSSFAEGDRYSNINLLVGSPSNGDPVAAWHTSVDLPIFEHRVTQRRRDRIEQDARYMSSVMGASAAVLHISETGDTVTSVEDASYRTGVFEAVAPYRQIYVLQIIRYWVEIIGELQYPAMGVSQDIPFFSEIFGGFYNPDSYLKTRKT